MSKQVDADTDAHPDPDRNTTPEPDPHADPHPDAYPDFNTAPDPHPDAHCHASDKRIAMRAMPPRLRQGTAAELQVRGQSRKKCLPLPACFRGERVGVVGGRGLCVSGPKRPRRSGLGDHPLK